MHFSLHLIATVLCLISIIFSCILFTNAIEHLGKKLKLGSNATGSILAVIGTTLPETIVPLIAILGSKIFNSDTGEQIALGGIFGSPFMLLCLALFMLGVEIVILKLLKKRKSLNLEINKKYVLRDFKYFLSAYIPAVFCLFIQQHFIKIIIVIYLISLYVIYVSRTILNSKQNVCEETIDELIIAKFTNTKTPPSLSLIILQIIFSLLFLVCALHYFIVEIKYFSVLLNTSPIIISLVITPFATELPECINSLIWIKNKKDDLALFNINGAIIFQAIIPMSIGILLTPFEFNKVVLINVILVIIASIIFIINLLINKKINYISLLICGIFYFAFVFGLLYSCACGNLF